MFGVLEGGARSSLTLNTLMFGGDKDDPYEWTSRIDEYFTLRNLPNEQRLSLVCYHLDGKALEWFYWLETNDLLMSLGIFLQMVKFRFGSKIESRLEGLKLVKNHEGGELKCYELETKDEKVVDGMISSSSKTKVNGNVDKGFECKMSTITKGLVQNEAIGEENLNIMDAMFNIDTPLVHSCVDVFPMFANEEKNGLGGKHKVYVARRTTFKYYALKEVYADS